jgi:hypothetical protein
MESFIARYLSMLSSMRFTMNTIYKHILNKIQIRKCCIHKTGNRHNKRVHFSKHNKRSFAVKEQCL